MEKLEQLFLSPKYEAKILSSNANLNLRRGGGGVGRGPWTTAYTS